MSTDATITLGLPVVIDHARGRSIIADGHSCRKKLGSFGSLVTTDGAGVTGGYDADAADGTPSEPSLKPTMMRLVVAWRVLRCVGPCVADERPAAREKLAAKIEFVAALTVPVIVAPLVATNDTETLE